MSWTTFAAARVGRSAARFGGAMAPDPTSILDRIVFGGVAAAIGILAAPILVGQALGYLVGLGLDYGVSWIVGSLVMSALGYGLCRAVLRYERGPADAHRWRYLRRSCACGWSQRAALGWRHAGLNHPAHAANAATLRPSEGDS